MASPSESKMDENEVTSERHNRREEERNGEEQELDVAFPLMRQSSIYSLTLDEIQNTVCEPGKTFGSMNMDEFLTNIWSVEEGFAANTAAADSGATTNASNGGGGCPPLHRQGSLTLPAPLSRKTVDEVWADIHRGEQAVHRVDRPHHGTAVNAPRQPTFGEMTLEDFLVRAGVVRVGSPCASSPHAPPVSHLQQQYGMPNYQMGAEAPGFGHVMGIGYEQSLGTTANGAYHHQVVGDSNGYAAANSKRGDSYGAGVCFGGGGGRLGNGYGLGSPASPISSDGLGGGQVDNGGLEHGGTKGGRKRVADGTVEKVVERRQRRMIKNRESAARSRARKQAYTVELEAEINQLKEENARLREEERRVHALRKQLLLESMAKQAPTVGDQTAPRLRRCKSGQW